MTLSDWLTFRFPSQIEVEGGLPPADVMQSIALLTAPKRALEKEQRRKPLRGTLDTSSGVLRWPLTEYRLQSFRALHFRIDSSITGSRLIGQFRIFLAYRIIVMLWLYFGLAFNAEQILVPAFIYHVPLTSLKAPFLFMAIGPAMSFGYTWFVLAIGRRREKDLIRVLTATMQNQEQAAATRFLLTR